MTSKNGCLICGSELTYLDEEAEVNCYFCNKTFKTKTICDEGHYVCDSCHSKEGIDAIISYCLESKSKDPIFILNEIMENPFIYMHGPEHHVMVGAALLTAYANAGGDINLEKALKDMKIRGGQYPGGSCGFWGTCGAAVSLGMFLSIITQSTPLSTESWGIINRGTVRALDEIGKLGGPRCCKRNSFTAALTGADYVLENFGVKMDIPDQVTCRFFRNNRQCLGKRCPYFPNKN
ncbi:DUF5714 domain-containing protein [Neofamilia massiliensis]|uniref:DUF5714 domain-containing protein n=1 Tax=Neofamilia massiliensis TaxID=1673724 RepID=UPI0006BB852B|nr:DUF5714 domain-containing protein [Neofamilia massiliensis]